jgi:hypothetical protein
VPSRFEFPEKSNLLTPNQVESSETFNDVNVDNALRFLTHPQSTWLVKPNQSYCNRKIARKCEFQKKAGNRLGVGAW